MRPLMLCALLILVPTAVGHGSSAWAQTVPESSPSTPTAPLQLGQIWRLEGQTDQGRSFRSELRLAPFPADQRAALEQGFRQTAGAAKISALFAGTPRGPGRAQVLMLSRAAEQDMVVVLPSPSAEDVEAALAEELAFCFLLPDAGGRSFSGLSLRLRGEGETYSVTGTVGNQGSEREQMLKSLRAIYTPLFGVGECRLTRR